jgi:predicted DNA-binding transcriptional regulator YafY
VAHPSEANRGEKLRRQLRLVSALMKGEILTRQRATRLLGTGVAAADRHLRVLRDMPGVSVTRGGGLSFNRAALLQQASFPTAIAACLSHSMATLFRGTSYEKGMREALDLVVSATSRRALFRDLRRKFVFVAKGGDSSLEEQGGLLDDLIDSVLHSKKAKITYRHFDGSVEHLKVEPLSVVVYEHQLYVFGKTARTPIHPYRFARIESVDKLAEGFQYPTSAEYDPDRLFLNGFGIYLGDGAPEDVRVRLSDRWRTYALTHRWHQTQRVELAQGSVEIGLNIRITPEVVTWILGFGADAEVLAPASLRKRVAREVRAMGAVYSSGPDGHS